MQPTPNMVHVPGRIALKKKLAEFSTAKERNKFSAVYHERLGVRGTTTAKAMAEAVEFFGKKKGKE